MNITISWPQLLKLRSLSAEELEKLRVLVGRGGVMETSDLDELHFTPMRRLHLVKMKAGKAWTAFEVNGTRPAPFVGNAKAPRSRPDHKEMAAKFAKLYRKKFGENYGSLEALEWVFLTRMSKEYTLAEFEALAALLLRTAAKKDASIRGLYAKRQALARNLAASAFQPSEEGGDDDDGGW